MLGLDPNLVVHNIMTHLDAKVIKKKLCKFNLAQSLWIKATIQKLLKSKFIESIKYPKWASNMIPINHADGNLHISMDFYDLNKAYLKDDFPLPKIDILVDNTMGYEILSLMDGFSGYNQIWVNPND